MLSLAGTLRGRGLDSLKRTFGSELRLRNDFQQEHKASWKERFLTGSAVLIEVRWRLGNDCRIPPGLLAFTPPMTEHRAEQSRAGQSYLASSLFFLDEWDMFTRACLLIVGPKLV